MKNARTTQLGVNQGNHSAGDAIPLGKNVLSYTVKNPSASGANLWIGINEDASSVNLLQPGESMTIVIADTQLWDQVYLDFDPTQTGGQALVIVSRNMGDDYCG
jgi:hypothetical protein